MSKPALIGNVLPRVTFNGYVSFAEQAERQAAADLRMGRNEAAAERAKAAAAAREAEAIASLGRGEYLSLRHAKWKEKLYERDIRREDWDRFQMTKLQKRISESERHKAEWQEFDPESVVVDLERLPAW